MDIEAVKRETLAALGGRDLSEVDYITSELLAEYEGEEVADDEEAALQENALASPYGVYGNSLVFKSGYVYYKRNDKGTPNYGCGTNNWKWKSKQGDTHTPLGMCSGGRREYKMMRAG